ncbi:putative mucin/carbohydrate-binding domain-containing protein [Bacillus thuringiensis]|uniref:putative mucin/carbohydrate-binding domain-containing protein n=1 Tax=Bacillus thuringiensis TaxID=1428 RepID=UPI002AB357F0|nr:putative mucin/carbohydrate-binding domain-containing protein [Bacillus thuringiensis]MDY7962722.1 putative mucin/carbohydrate-binding domain-containing protein [Bacillus thuringiensis]
MRRISSLLLTMPIILGSITTIPHTKVSAKTMSFNQEAFTLETLNQQTDQAIANGNFETHLNNLTAYLNGNVGGMTEENLKKKLADPVFAAALAQWQFISQPGATTMNAFAKKDADHQKFLSWAMKNTNVMNTYLEGGSPTGKNPINALEIWNTIWNADTDSHEGMLLKLAIATSLAHAEPIKYWTNNQPINPLTRYQHYKLADQNNELLPCFRTYDVWHLRLVVNTWSPEEDLTWARNMINTEHPELKNQDKVGESAYLINYVTHNKDGVSIQAGNDAFYGLDWNLSSIYKFGGVCGNISKFGTQVSQAFGVAAMPVGQPGHCALIWNNKPSSWNLGNDISGWSESSRHDATVIPWSDNSPTNQVPYMLLFENAERDPVKLDQSERLRWLAKAMTSADNKLAIYKISTNILPINFLVWEDYVSLMLQNPNVTDAEWRELNNSIISAFANEQRPLRDLLTQIKSHVPNADDILEGKQFSWSLKGIGDFEFAKVNLNKSTEEMQIDLKAGVPHNYFDSTYASIKVQNTSGKVVYNKEINGKNQQNAEQAKVPVKVGDFIEFTHLEGANRAIIKNMEKNIQESFGNKAVYEITKEGLKKVDKIVNPKPDTEAPTQPQGLYASNVTSDSIELKWNPSTDNIGVKEYQVLRDGQLIQTVQGTTFTDQNLTANKDYKYAVKAVDTSGNISIQSNILPVKTKNQNVSNEKWDPWKAYKKGDKVEHQGKVYEAVQNHQGNGDPNWIFALALWNPLT